MVFLYFLPRFEPPQISPEILTGRGLGETLRDCLGSDLRERLVIRGCGRGPDGGGVIVAPLPVGGELAGQSIGFYPDRQTWQPVTSPQDGPLYWIGVDREQPPQPEGLRRQVLVDGIDYALGDGRVWRCPTIRRLDGAPLLPSGWAVDDSGQFTTRVLDEYQADWKLAGEMWDVFSGARSIEPPESFAYAIRALSINYRIGPQEASRLSLLTSENYPLVFKAAVDGERLETFLNSPEGQAMLADLEGPAFDPEKKTAETPETASFSAGPRDNLPPTDRAAPSCISPAAAT